MAGHLCYFGEVEIGQVEGPLLLSSSLVTLLLVVVVIVVVREVSCMGVQQKQPVAFLLTGRDLLAEVVQAYPSKKYKHTLEMYI